MNNIFTVWLVKVHLRRPKTAEIISAERNKLLFAPVNKVVASPKRKTFTAVAVYIAPVNIVVFVHVLNNAKVCGDNYKAAGSYPDNFNVTAAHTALVAGDDGIAAVYTFPVVSVAADRKIDLFAVNDNFFLEMSK